MDFSTALGFAVVLTAACSVFGFNRPSWLRTYTTAARYYDGLLIHMSLYVGLLLLVCVPLYALRHWLPMGKGTSVVVLALGVVLFTRVLPRSARGMREWAHRLAGIPATGHAFAGKLAEAAFHPGDADREEATRMLATRSIDVHDDALPPVRAVLALAEKATALFLQLRKWEEERRYGPFLVEARNDFATLRHRFDRLLQRVARAVADIDKLGKLHWLAAQAPRGSAPYAEDPDELVKAMVDHRVSELCEELRQFHREACLFAVRGAMSVHWTRAARSKAIAALGFEEGNYEPPPTYWVVILQMGLVLYFGCWMFWLLGGSFPENPGELDHAAKFLVATLVVLASMGVAALPKRRWGFANAGIHHRTPRAFVVGAGVAAMLLSVLLALLVDLHLEGSIARLAATKWTLLMLHSAFLTATVTAWLVQDHRWRAASEARKRWLDALVFTATWLASTAVWMLLVRSPALAEALGTVPRVIGTGQAIATFLFSAAVASTIGYFVPRSVRVPPPQPLRATESRDVKALLAEVERLAVGVPDSEPPIAVFPTPARPVSA